jgi:hypothetical protein
MVKTNISDKEARNKLNITIRSQPWYQDYFKSRGLDPNQVQLSKAQQQELQQLTVSNGFLDPSDGHIDPAGNVSDFHGWKGLPTAAKVAIIAGAAAATAGAAGAFGGGAGAASAASGTGGSIAAGGGVAAGGAGATVGTTGAIAGTLSAIDKAKSTYDKVNNIIGAAGRGVGAATTAAGAARLEDEDRQARAAGINIQGQAAQAAQDTEARRNLYRASVARNPMAGPNNARGLPTISPEMMQGLSSFEQAALKQAASAQERKPFTPYVPNLQKSTMERTGSWLSPILSTYEKIAPLLKRNPQSMDENQYEF